MQALPIIIAAVGTAASMSAEQRAASERRDVLNRQLDRTSKATDASTSMVQQEGKRFSQEQRLAGLQGQEQKTYDQTQADLNGAGGASVATAADNANVSDDFLKTKAARAIEEGTRLTSIAREAAKTRAPSQLQQDDSLSMAGLAGDLQNLWGTNRNMAQATGLDVQGVQTPMYGSLGKIATAVGGSMAGGYGQPSQTGAVPPNPMYRAPSGINFGGR